MLTKILSNIRDLHKNDLESSQLFRRAFKIPTCWRRWCRASSFRTRTCKSRGGPKRPSWSKTRQLVGQHCKNVCDLALCIQSTLWKRGSDTFRNFFCFLPKHYSNPFKNLYHLDLEIILYMNGEVSVVCSHTFIRDSSRSVPNLISLRRTLPKFPRKAARSTLTSYIDYSPKASMV